MKNMSLRGRRVKRTLRFVNRCRAIQGRKPLKRLPRGTRLDGRGCVIAVSLSYGSSAVSHWHSVQFPLRSSKNTPHVTVQYPEYVEEFIDAFDSGRIPELVKKGK